MERGGRLVVGVLLALVVLAILVPLLKWALSFLFGLLNLAVGLLYLALIIGAILFVAGLIRRLLRV